MMLLFATGTQVTEVSLRILLNLLELGQYFVSLGGQHTGLLGIAQGRDGR